MIIKKIVDMDFEVLNGIYKAISKNDHLYMVPHMRNITST